jgi:hypothetical protein
LDEGAGIEPGLRLIDDGVAEGRPAPGRQQGKPYYGSDSPHGLSFIMRYGCDSVNRQRSAQFPPKKLLTTDPALPGLPSSPRLRRTGFADHSGKAFSLRPNPPALKHRRDKRGAGLGKLFDRINRIDPMKFACALGSLG